MLFPFDRTAIQISASGLSDQQIADIADDIETEDQVERLGRALGLGRAEINRHLETNRLGGRVTAKGTRDMLFTWRQHVIPSEHHVTLKKALHESGLLLLADRHLQATLIPDGKFEAREDYSSITLMHYYLEFGYSHLGWGRGCSVRSDCSSYLQNGPLPKADSPIPTHKHKLRR